MKFTILILIFMTFWINLTKSDEYEDPPRFCSLNPKLVEEIKRYQGIANKIMKAVIHGEFKGATYKNLATFIDTFGARLTGTPNLEKSIDYLANKVEEMGLENVRFENVTVPRWVRGKESATLIEPHPYNIRMLGLGSSVGTKKSGIKAEAIVVNDFDDLKRKCNLVSSKIVVYNQKYISYHESKIYRTRGASEAAKLGAVAVLISSITPLSLDTPHTGMQNYEPNVTRIPAACISPQDAHMLHRMQSRCQKIVINLKMEAHNLAPTQSRNTLAELEGCDPQKRDNIVLVTGHIDSWDVGQGAMDDGGGAFVSWMSLAVLKMLGLRRPKRTIIAALFTGEEMGLIGAKEYVNAHCDTLLKYNYVMESDGGTFWPTGLVATGTDEAICIIKEVLSLLSPIGATTIRKGTTSIGPDISNFLKRGIPGAILLNKNAQYFVYHHSEADTMDVEDPKALDYATALFATVSYVIADLSVDLPKSDCLDKD